MATPQSLRRIARLSQKLESDLRRAGMAYPWKSLFRTNAILTRIVAHLADHLASQAEEKAEGAEKSRRQALPRRTRTSVPVENEE